MLDPALATAEMKIKTGPHHSPAQTRSPAHGHIRIGYVQNSLLNEVSNLAIESALKPVRHMANDFFFDMDWLFADGCVELHRALDGLWRGLLAGHNFNQRHHVGRIEGMADDAAFGVCTGRLHDAHRQPGGTRRNDRVGWSRRIHISEELNLEVFAFGSVLLDKVSIRERLLRVRRELQMIARRVGREANHCKVLPRRINVLAQVCFRIWRRVRCDDIETTCEVQRCPTRANDSRTNDCYVSNLLILCHSFLLKLFQLSKKTLFSNSNFYLPTNAGLTFTFTLTSALGFTGSA